MNAASGQTTNQALERVAELFADGQLDAVEELLSAIIANGDEVQQQIGLIYREQLELLRAEADTVTSNNKPLNDSNDTDFALDDDSSPVATLPPNPTAAQSFSVQFIEGLLEQVAERFADGQLDDLEALLPTIIANGDDIQRQMGEVYWAQLNLLRTEADDPIVETDTALPKQYDNAENNHSSALDTSHDTTLLDDGLSLNTRNLFSHAVPEGDTASYTTDDEDRTVTLPTDLVKTDNVSEYLSTVVANSDCNVETVVSYDETGGQTSAADNTQKPLSSVCNEWSASPISDIDDETEKETETQALHDDATATVAQPVKKQTRTLEEMVLKRAVSLLDSDPKKASRMLHGVIEAGTPVQQEQARTYLARITNDLDAEITNNINHQHVTNVQNALPKPAEIVADTVLPSPTNEDEKSTFIIECDDGEYDDLFGLVTVEATTLPDIEMLTISRVEDTTVIPSNQSLEHIDEELYASTDGLRSPSEVLQENYAIDALPLRDDDAGILQHEQCSGQQHRQGFYVGNMALMIEFADGSELTDMPTTYRVPNAPEWLLGLTNVHSVIIPVFDLVKFFGLNDTITGKTMMLIIGHGDEGIGIVISGLPKRLQWQSNQTVDPNTAPRSLRRCIRNSCLIDNQLWFDLDCAALTSALKTAMRSHSQ